MEPEHHHVLRLVFRCGCWLAVVAVSVAAACWWELAGAAGDRGGSPVARQLLYLLGLFVLATGLSAAATEVVFRWLLPARCWHCGGRMRRRWDRTVKYRCRTCGYEQDTGLRAESASDGTGGGGSWDGGGHGA